MSNVKAAKKNTNVKTLPESMTTEELEKRVWKEGLIKLIGYFNGKEEGIMAKIVVVTLATLSRDKAATTQRMKFNREVAREEKKLKQLSS